MGLGQGPIGKDRLATYAIAALFAPVLWGEERNRTTVTCKVCGTRLAKGTAREIGIGCASMRHPGRYFICDPCREVVEAAWAACPEVG